MRVLGVVDHLDDAAAIERVPVALVGRLDAQQRAVADAGGGAAASAARGVTMRIFGAVPLLVSVPFGGRGDQFAVACRGR